MTGEKGFEPLTFGFGNHYSTVETILLLFEEWVFSFYIRHSFVLLRVP